MSRITHRWRNQIVQFWAIALSVLSLTTACSNPNVPPGSGELNSRYNDEQPSLSGDGRFLSFVSNRNGISQILIYDLERQRFVEATNLNKNEVLAQSPSLSRTGRYIVYLVNEAGRPEIALYDRAIQRSQILSQNYRSWVRNPQISPDGRYLVFESARRGQWDIEVLDRGPRVELDVRDGTPVPNFE
ncbi:MAG: biopolymer transporter Tol [Oscillatoria sp. PMC 1068.18]|nr:biopolymer transporter Tol [Oscillatoria sp. PMC 1076.18]MEC4990173.1 biopolymer transporter Tol [Oscillatoria sp. PMC 1068.18]